MAVLLFRPVSDWLFYGALLAWLLGRPGAIVAQAPASPPMQWATSLNPSGLGGVITSQALARDPSGNLYITGSFTGSVQLGPHWLRSASRRETTFVAKRSPAGRWQWAQKLPADSISGGESLSVDRMGGLYLTGYYEGAWPFEPLTPPALATPSLDARQHFIARLDTAGHWQWAQVLTTHAQGQSLVATDTAGAAYVNGGPASAGAALAGKISRSGRWQWTTLPPAGTTPRVAALAVSPAGRLYLTGSLYPKPSASGPVPEYQPEPPPGLPRPFVSCLGSTGRWAWTATAQPYSDMDRVAAGTALRVGPDGSVFVAGRYQSALRFGAGRTIALPGQTRTPQVFVARLSPAGVWQWATAATSTSTNRSSFGPRGKGEVTATGLDLDAMGKLCLTGSFRTIATFATRPAPTRLSGGGPFIAWMSPQGEWLTVATPTTSPYTPRPYTAQALMGAGNGQVDLLCPLQVQDDDDAGISFGVFRVDQRHPQRWVPWVQTDAFSFSTSEVQAVAYAGHGELAVAGVFQGRLNAPGTPLHGRGQNLLVGVLGAKGAWRWRQAREFRAGVSVRGLFADSSGRLYVLGLYRSPVAFRLDSNRVETTLDPMTQETNSGNTSTGWFIAQLDRNGEWRWARRVGPAAAGVWAWIGKDASLAVDPAGNAWVALVTDSLRAWGPSGVQVSLQRWDADGRLQESRPLARGDVRVSDLICGRDGELYFGGDFTDSTEFALHAAPVRLRIRRPEGWETFVGKLAPGPGGEWALSTGVGFEMTALAPAPEGGLWVGGSLEQDTVRLPTLPTPTVLTRVPGAVHAGVVGRLDAQGTWRWGQRVGTSRRDRVLALATDLTGNLHVAGSFEDTTLTVATRPVATQLRSPSSQSVFLAQLSPAKQWLAARTLPANVSTFPFAMVPGPTGQLYVSGALDHSFLFDAPAGAQPFADGQVLCRTGFAACLNPLVSDPERPLLQTMRPSRGKPGTRVRLQGAHLGGVSQVRVGGVIAEMMVESDEQLVVTVPASAGPGAVRIDVVTPAGQARAPQPFRVR